MPASVQSSLGGKGQSASHTPRPTTSAERSKVEATLAALRKPTRMMALWTGGIFAVSSIAVVVTVVSEYITHAPSDWWHALVAIPATFVVIVGIPSAMMWRSWVLGLQLAKDVANGLPLRQAEGTVEWSALYRTLVATAAGKSLRTFPTAHVPRSALSFDALRPGRYQFRMLACSRLVLSAEPIDEDGQEEEAPAPLIVPNPNAGYREPAAHVIPAETTAPKPPSEPLEAVALRRAFWTSEEDLEENHLGRISRHQKIVYFVRGPSWQIACAAFFGGLTYLSATSLLEEPAVGGFFGLAICIAGSLVFLWMATETIMDLVRARVTKSLGTPSMHHYRHDSEVHVAGAHLKLSRSQANALHERDRYCFFSLPRTKRVIAVLRVEKKEKTEKKKRKRKKRKR